jgi:hypothetical protein
MRMVIDSNYLQAPELENYLKASKRNLAVLTDYVAMEAYKGNSIESITKSMAILCKFPGQVIVLKGTSTICRLKGHRKGLLGRLIDEKQSAGFESFAKAICVTSDGSKAYHKMILDHGAEATNHIQKMKHEAAGIPEGILMLEKCFTKEEKAILRNKARMPEELRDKVMYHIMEIAGNLFSHFPNRRRFQEFEELFNTYIFRYSAAAYILFIKWITRGGVGGVKPERLRNDLVDLSYVTYATFFDGLLTKDAKALDVYHDTKELLWKFGV